MANEQEAKLQELSLFLGAILIVFLQFGFSMLQIGGVQYRRSRKMFIKSVFDMSITGLGWWFIGYGIAYGKDQNQFAGSNKYTLNQANNQLWFLSWSMCSISLSVVSSCLAERIRFGAYVVQATLYVVFIFPFVVHWAWGDGWASPFRSRISEELLGGCGVLDYAGAGVLHLTGGVTAFIVSKLIGPRRGRFSSPGLHFHEYSTLFQSVGAIAMWIGWYGVILGSSNANAVPSDTISRSMASTTIAACSGCMTSVLLGYVLNGFISPSLSNGGVLSGLVAISAACATCTMYGALIIGILAGCLYYISSTFLVYLEIDDVVDAIPVHMINGAWGLIAAGLFTTKEFYSEAYSGLYSDGRTRADHCAGLFYGGSGYQLGSNICFILTIISWCGALSFISHFVVDLVLGMQWFENSRKARESIGYGSPNQNLEQLEAEHESL